MRLTDIGHQLKAFRLESGLKADEIAQRLGISRAALYRYEKGEVIKLDTVQRLAELLKVSPLSLLGIGVEYYQRQAAFFERLRQIEETADTILQVGGALTYHRSSDEFQRMVVEAIRHGAGDPGADPTASAIAEATIQALEARQQSFALRQPSMIVLVSLDEVENLLQHGLRRDLAPGTPFEVRCREAVAVEIERLATQIEVPPMDYQVGIIRDTDVNGSFRIMKQRDRSMLAINPFRVDGALSRRAGVAVVTAAAEAVTAHQRVAESLWRSAIKGETAAAMLREVLARHMRRAHAA